MSTERSDFTQGSILKKLSFFMLPVLGALILQAAYGAVDLLVVGQFGSTAVLSAVSTGSQILNLVAFVVTQLAMGVTVLIARYLGEKRPEQIGAILGGAAVVFTILSVGIFILLVGFARPISVLMQAPEEAIDLTASYVRICGGGIFFIVAYNLLSAIFRGLGDSRSPLIFVLVACIVNIAGDLLLVAVFGMDAAGAAIATVAAQAVSVVFAVVMLKGDVLAGIFSPDAEVVQKGFAYLKGFAPETIVTAVLQHGRLLQRQQPDALGHGAGSHSDAARPPAVRVLHEHPAERQPDEDRSRGPGIHYGRHPLEHRLLSLSGPQGKRDGTPSKHQLNTPSRSKSLPSTLQKGDFFIAVRCGRPRYPSPRARRAGRSFPPPRAGCTRARPRGSLRQVL